MLFCEIVLEDSQGTVTHGRNAFDKSMEAWVANTHIQYLKPLGESCIHKNTPPSRTHLQLDMFGWEINTQLLLGNIPMIAVCFHLKTLFEGNTTFGGHWGIQQGR